MADEEIQNSGMGDSGDTSAAVADKPKSGGEDTSNPEMRSLEELNSLANDADLKLSAAESKKITLAGLNPDKSEDELNQLVLDQFNEKDGKKKTPKKKPEEDLSQETDNETEDTEDTEEEPEDSTADEEEAEENEENNEEDSEETEESDVDSLLLKELAPHLPKNAETLEDAVQAIKDLNYKLNRSGEFVNAAKKFGVTDTKGLTEAFGTLTNFDAMMKEKLSSQEGLDELFKAYGVNPLGNNNRSQGKESPTKNEGAEVQVDLDKLLSDIEEDGYISASDFKRIIPNLTSQVTSQVMEKYKGLEEQMGQVGTLLDTVSKRNAQSQRFQKMVSDVQEISTMFGNQDPSLKLVDTPENIFNTSVRNGKVVAKPHKEFKKFDKLMKIRQEVYKAHEGQDTPVDVGGYLAKRFIKEGDLSNLLSSAKKDAASNLASNLARKLQPKAGGKRSKGGRKAPFKVPQSETDVSNMSKEERRTFLRKLARGDIKVGT